METNTSKANSGCLVALVLMGLLFVSCVVFVSRSDIDTSGPALSARAFFDGSQFVIENNNMSDWTDVTVEVNDAYELRVDKVTAGQTVRLPAMQLSNSDGMRFNPITMKPRTVTIRATLKGVRAAYRAEWQ